MKKILFLFLSFIFFNCSNIQYIENYGSKDQKLAEDGRVITEYKKYTFLENNFVICKDGYEIDGLFNGIIKREIAVPLVSKNNVVIPTIIESYKNNKIYIRKYEDVFNIQNNILTIINGIEKITTNNVEFSGSIENIFMTIPNNNIVIGLGEKNYINNNKINYSEYSLKIKDFKNKQIDSNFIFLKKQINEDILILEINNLYKYNNILKNELDKYFLSLKESPYFYGITTKNEVNDFMLVENKLSPRFAVELLPISILKFDKDGIDKKYNREVILKKNLKTNKILNYKYYVDNKQVDTSIYSDIEKEKIGQTIIEAEIFNFIEKIKLVLEQQRIEQIKQQNLSILLELGNMMIENFGEYYKKRMELRSKLRNSSY